MVWTFSRPDKKDLDLEIVPLSSTGFLTSLVYSSFHASPSPGKPPSQSNFPYLSRLNFSSSTNWFQGYISMHPHRFFTPVLKSIKSLTDLKNIFNLYIQESPIQIETFEIFVRGCSGT